MSTSKASRQSNIELLRIFAAFLVIIVHYINPGLGGGLSLVERGTPNQMLLFFFETICITAVNLYILISGYFMRDSLKRDWLKPIGLLAQMIVIETVFMLVKELPKGSGISFDTIKAYFVPTYWFIFVYIALYMLSPYLNLVWKKLEDKQKNTLVALSVVLLAVYPFIVDSIGHLTADAMQGKSTLGLDGAQNGYTLVQFFVMYLIGIWLRDRADKPVAKKKKAWKYILLLLLDMGALYGWAILDSTVLASESALFPAWEYINPLVMLEAVLFFEFFSSIDMKSNRVINALAAASFPSYLIHLNLFEYAGIDYGVSLSPGLMLLHMFGVTIAIYLVSFVIHFIYRLIEKPIMKAVGEKWQKHRFISVE